MSLIQSMTNIIPADKLKHLGVGLLVAAVMVALWFIEDYVAPALVLSYPWLFATLNGAACVHATKEVADWLDNQIVPGMHSVEFRDWLAGMVGSLVFVAFFIGIMHVLVLM